MFEFRVILDELLKAQSTLTMALNGKDQKPILQMIFLDVQSHQIVMRGFNGHLQIERSVAIHNEGSEIQICLPVFMFTVLQEYDRNGQIEISQMIGSDDKLLNKILVSQDTRSNEFSFVEGENYPDKIDLDYKPIKDMNTLLEAFSLVAVGTADAAKKPALRCFHLDSMGHLMSGNGTQFALHNGLSLSTQKDMTLVRAKVVLDNLKVLNEISLVDDSEIGFDENWLGYRSVSSGIEIIFQQYTGDPIDFFMMIFNKIKENKPVCSVTLNLGELNRILDLSALYENEALRVAYPAYTTITIDKEKTAFEIRIEDLSSNTEQITNQQMDGDEFTIQILSSKLKEMTTELKGDSVRIDFYSKRDPFRLMALDSDQFEYFQSP